MEIPEWDPLAVSENRSLDVHPLRTATVRRLAQA